MVKWKIALLSLTGFLTLGAASTTASAKTSKTPVTVNLVFNVRDQNGMNDYVNQTVDPTSPNYHQYLTPDQVADKYGRSSSQISEFTKYFSKYHLKSAAYPGNFVMKVQGSQTNLVKAFKAKPAKTDKNGDVSRTRLPGKLSSQVASVLGLYIENKKTSSKTDKKALKFTHHLVKDDAPIVANTKNQFAKKYGSVKFSDAYGVNKLYDQNLHGQGQRIGVIVTYEFNPKDVAEYWKQMGVNSDVSRIHKIYTTDKTDGPNPKTNDDVTSQEEASLDVEQAGSVADQAQIDAYVGVSKDDVSTPDVQYLDAFATAVGDNQDKQLTTSSSFGNELTGFGAGGLSETPAEFNDAINLVFEQAAIQGTVIFNAAGDAGPYEIPSKTRSLSFPTSPYAVQVGGTTLPYTKIIGSRLVQIPKERTWGDSYSQGIVKKPTIFPGGGGGFSNLNPTPSYQLGVPGVNTYNAFNMVKYTKGGYLNNPNPGMVSGTASGRNLPDISGNADEKTGYAAYMSYKNSSIWVNAGGTSFVAPQMAGASAVINSGLKTSAGFWNPQLYKFAVQPDTPFHVLDDATVNNTNLYYTGQPGKVYNQASGLGTVDFSKLFNKFNTQG
ncbi:S53 family peptidase [Lentilactobacillus otakiensis]|uniref:S53 family peptidase n=1 Tax=Lentilactobacillus otakiensis TaxID=481720 RepID=UPI003D180F14